MAIIILMKIRTCNFLNKYGKAGTRRVFLLATIARHIWISAYINKGLAFILSMARKPRLWIGLLILFWMFIERMHLFMECTTPVAFDFGKWDFEIEYTFAIPNALPSPRRPHVNPCWRPMELNATELKSFLDEKVQDHHPNAPSETYMYFMRNIWFDAANKAFELFVSLN